MASDGPGGGTDANIIIRAIESSDLDDILRIEEHSFPNPWKREAFLSELSGNPYSFLYGLFAGDRLLGYSVFWVLDEQAHLVNLAVDPDSRGRGYGRTLLFHALRTAYRRGADRLHLEVRENNQPAIALYRQFGFLPLGRAPGYYSDGTAALIMAVSLSGNPPSGQYRKDPSSPGKDMT